MTRLLKTGGTLGILIDQDIESVESVFVPFFDRLAASHAAPPTSRSGQMCGQRGEAERGGSRPCR